MINAYPTPTSSARINNYSAARIQIQNYDQGDVRMDEQITAKDSIFARWSIQNTATMVTQHLRARPRFPGYQQPVSLSDEASFAGTSFQPTQHVATSYVRVFSPSLVNDFRVGFNRYRLDYVPINFAPGRASAISSGFRIRTSRRASKTCRFFRPPAILESVRPARFRCIAGRTPFRSSTT